MAQGRVKWWNAEKGFGFLTVDGGGPDVFVHYSHLEMSGYRTLEDDQRVEFDIVQGAKGPQASRVRPIPRESIQLTEPRRSGPVAGTRSTTSPRPTISVPEAPETPAPSPVTPVAHPALPGSPLLPSDPRTVGPYSISRRLGEGSMGTVYLAHDRSARRVALKVIRDQFAQDAKFLRRFKSEAENARRVDASYTARVLDAAIDVDRPYLATEFIDGPTLADWVDSHGPLSGSDAKAIGVGIAAALIAIHDAGVIHRDLKPSNVMLSYHGPRVIDFGIARSLASTTVLTNTGYPVGTPAYMSPEQLEMQEDLAFASDIFSWGGVMTYATTGHEPFPAEGHFAVMFSIVSKPPVLHDVPDELRPLVSEALHKTPSSRPTARQLLARLTGGRH